MDHEVVVIGGGPAGSSCATFLAQAGHSVLLLEREPQTGFRVGESLLPALWEYWQRLGVLERIENAGFPVKRGVYFEITPQDHYLLRTDEFPQYFLRPYTFHVDRATYDRLLLENAVEKGVDVRMGATVTEVLFESTRAVGVAFGDREGHRETVRSRVVIDATGRSTLLGSRLNRRYPHPRLRKVAFFTHFDGAGRRLNEDGSTVTDIHATEGGWLWCIPLRGDKTSIGAVLDGEYVRTRGEEPEAIFRSAVEGDPEISGWIRGATQSLPLQRISSISYLSDSFVGDGSLMIGDAALFIDPIFSAGVTIAMRAADFAAEAVMEALATGDTSARAFKGYEERIRHPISKITRMIVNWYEIMNRKDRGNIFEWSRKAPLLRERLVVLLSGGYDKVDLEAIANWA